MPAPRPTSRLIKPGARRLPSSPAPETDIRSDPFDAHLDDPDIEELVQSSLELSDAEKRDSLAGIYGKLLFVKEIDSVVVPITALSKDSVRCMVVRSTRVVEIGKSIEVSSDELLRAIEVGVHMPNRSTMYRDDSRGSAKG